MRKTEKEKLVEVRCALLKLDSSLNLCFPNEEAIPTIDDINSIKQTLKRTIKKLTLILGDGNYGGNV